VVGSAVDAEAGIESGEGIAEWQKHIDTSIFSFTSENSFSGKLFNNIFYISIKFIFW